MYSYQILEYLMVHSKANDFECTIIIARHQTLLHHWYNIILTHPNIEIGNRDLVTYIDVYWEDI